MIAKNIIIKLMLYHN